MAEMGQSKSIHTACNSSMAEMGQSKSIHRACNSSMAEMGQSKSTHRACNSSMAEMGRSKSTQAVGDVDCVGDAHSEISSFSSTGLACMPGSVLEVILSHTTARDVKRLALVSSAFAEAARSDMVWQKFLPADYQEIAAKALNSDGTTPLRWDSLRTLHTLLCSHVLMGNGKEGYWIDMATGGTCRSYSARSLHICWGSNETYWNWLPEEGSRFKEVAYLRMVWWLDVSGEVKVKLPPGSYTLTWVLQFDWSSSTEDPPVYRRRRRNPWRGVFRGEDYYRWGASLPLTFRAIKWPRPVNFAFTDGVNVMESSIEFPPTIESGARKVDDLNRWEYDAGEFMVLAEDRQEVQLSFSLKDTDCHNAKSGLYIHGVVIRPTPVDRNKCPFDVFI